MTIDEQITLTCAFRYALGRKTYVADSVSSVLLHKWDELSKHHKELYYKEIMEAKEQNKLGMSCDERAWMRIVDQYLFDLRKTSA